MTLHNENPFQTTAKTPSSSPYLEITIILYKYGLLYLPTYHKSLCPNFKKKKVWLPTYSSETCPKLRSFFLGPSPNLAYSPPVECAETLYCF